MLVYCCTNQHSFKKNHRYTPVGLTNHRYTPVGLTPAPLRPSKIRPQPRTAAAASAAAPTRPEVPSPAAFSQMPVPNLDLLGATICIYIYNNIIYNI